MKKKLKLKIGFIGLGKMGKPMTRNLINNGYNVIGYDTNKKALQDLKKIGGNTINEIKNFDHDISVFITMLPNGDLVKNTVLNLVKYLDKKNPVVIIDMSSSDPIGTKQLYQNVKNKNIKLIDAPVSGGVKKAISGKLSIMVSGNTKTIKKVNPILSKMGDNIIEMGSLGSAHAMKAINNYVSAMGLMAVCEALIVGKKFGINLKTLNNALNVSSGKNNSTENKIEQFVLSNKFSSGFSLPLMSKDLSIAWKLSKKLNLNLSGISYASKEWKKANNKLNLDTDHTEIFKYIRNVSTKKI